MKGKILGLKLRHRDTTENLSSQDEVPEHGLHTTFCQENESKS